MLEIRSLIEHEEDSEEATMHHDRLSIGIAAGAESGEHSLGVGVDLHQFPASLLRAVHRLDAGKREVADLPRAAGGEALRRGGVGVAAEPPRLVEEGRRR